MPRWSPATIHRLAAAAIQPDSPGDDAQLLRSFLRRDPDAFAELVHRHGPMVYGVRYYLHNPRT